MKYVVTGTAGFIGFFTAQLLLRQGHEVVGIDAMVPYYDVKLKERRNDILLQHGGFTTHKADLADMEAVTEIFNKASPQRVIHLAAQAGVRYSLEYPETYIHSNIVGTFNLLEQIRRKQIQHFLMASTSSAYGASTDYPYRELQAADTPLTIYAATKRAGEHMCHSYANLWGQAATVFRFFSVYGPWGRPDMALFKFTDAILKGEPIEIYNHGNMVRDFTYVEDLVKAIVLLADAIPVAGQAVGDFDSISPVAPYRLVNIGNGDPVPLMTFIEEIEKSAGKTAIKTYLPMQPGDVEKTFADTRLLQTLTGFTPEAKVDYGVAEFVRWFREYYQV